MRGVDSKADKQHIGLRVGKRAETVVLLLAGSVPQCQLNGFSRVGMNLMRDVVLKYRRDVFLGRDAGSDTLGQW